MLNEQRRLRGERWAVNGMSLLGILLLIVFVVSCCYQKPVTQDAPTEPTSNNTETTHTTEPNRFVECQAIFGENSIGNALLAVDFDTLTRNDKNTIQYLVLKYGGAAMFNDTHVLLTQGNSSMKIYPDKTYTMLDGKGNSTGTRWVRTQYSSDLPVLENQLLLCTTTPISFIARYRVEDATVFTNYCDSLQKLGYTQELFTSSIMFTGTTKDGITASVSFSDNLLTILIESEATT